QEKGARVVFMESPVSSAVSGPQTTGISISQSGFPAQEDGILVIRRDAEAGVEIPLRGALGGATGDQLEVCRRGEGSAPLQGHAAVGEVGVGAQGRGPFANVPGEADDTVAALIGGDGVDGTPVFVAVEAAGDGAL